MAQLGVDARRAVDAAVGAVDLDGSARSARRRSRARALGTLARPVVVARAADAEQPAGHGDRGAGLLRRDQPVDAHRVSVSAAKKAAARLSRSRSCFSRAFSRRSRRSSSRSALVGTSSRSRRSTSVLAAPVAQRLLGHAEALGELARGAAGTQHLHRLTAELRRVRGSGLGHVGHHPFAPSGRKLVRCPEKRGNSTGSARPLGVP